MAEAAEVDAVAVVVVVAVDAMVVPVALLPSRR